MLLQVLHARIDERTRSIAESQLEWPCRKGCDQCCRRLAAIPELTQAEWELLREGLAALPAEVQHQIAERTEALQSAEAPYTCPYLDREQGSCRVYAQRPIACRTYGFYVERDKGLYCTQIEERVASGEFSGVVWGNVAGVDAAMVDLGSK